MSTGLDPMEICTLSSDELGERASGARREILPHAIETLRIGPPGRPGVAIELAERPGLAAKLDDWIALERRCCSAIGFERAASATPGRLRLEIRGVDPDAPIFASQAVPRSQAPSRRSRLAQAAGLGLTTSLLLCCVLPVAAAAMVGAAAAPLAALDGPGPIAAGALLGAAAAWWWLGRRGRR